MINTKEYKKTVRNKNHKTYWQSPYLDFLPPFLSRVENFYVYTRNEINWIYSLKKSIKVHFNG